MFEGWTSPFAQANQQAQDRATAWDAIKADPSSAALIAGLSLLSNNNGSRSFGQLVGRAGFDTLAGLGSMEAQRRAQERYQQEQDIALADAARKRQKDAWDMGMQAAQFGLDRDKYLLDRDKQAAELAGWRMLQGMGGAPSVGSEGVSGAPNSSNPLNMRVPGSTNFQSFNSPGDAFNAYLGQLRRYQGRGLMTPAQMIAGDDIDGKYVPGWAPAADGNDTGAYIRNVGKWSGIDMFAPINLDDPVAVSQLMSGMARMEQRDGTKWTPEAVRDALYGGQVGGGNPLAPPVIPESAKGTNPLAPGQVPDSVPRVHPQGTIPQTFGGLDRATLERVALLPGDAGAAARQILSMRKDAFGSQQAKIDDVSGLGKRWTAESADYLSSGQSLAAMMDYADQQSGAGDLGLIFSYMKMLDPASVVREGEQVQAVKTGNIGDQLWATYEKVASGEKLTPKQRYNFIRSAAARFNTLTNTQKRLNKHFEGIANEYRISPSLIITDLYSDLPEAVSAWMKNMEGQINKPESLSATPPVVGSAFAGRGAGGGGGGGVGAGTGGPMKDISDDDLLTALGLK